MYSLISQLVALWLTAITHYHTQTAVQLINSALVNTTENISKQAVSFFVLGCDYKLFPLLSPLLIMFVKTKQNSSDECTQHQPFQHLRTSNPG